MLSLAALQHALGDAQLLLADPALVQQTFVSVGTDTRTIAPGSLFVALRGPNFDGHQFINTAFERGAVAALCQQPPADPKGPCVVVTDSLKALQKLASHWRSVWPGQMIAVTGSNGKTTVKQMIAQILRAQAGPDAAWATPGNLNNHIGVPLSVLGLRPNHQMAVLELGMNHPGEIPMLAAIARPSVALVNNAQREHQEFMHSVMAVALENGEVFKQLDPNGWAVYPRDKDHEPHWARLAQGRRQIRFGFTSEPGDEKFNGPEVLVIDQEGSLSGPTELMLPGGLRINVQIKAIGRHVALNAAAAAACAFAAGCSAQAIQSGLSQFEPVAGRGTLHPLPGGGVLVDDTYNANPDSVRAAIDALISLPAPHGLILGDMGEVGDQSEAFHEEVLRHAQSCHVSSIWLHGQALDKAQRATGIGRHFSDITALVSDARRWLGTHQSAQGSPSVWAKGSRFMKMERVVAALIPTAAEAPSCS